MKVLITDNLTGETTETEVEEENFDKPVVLLPTIEERLAAVEDVLMDLLV
jgi:hypothetical protein